MNKQDIQLFYNQFVDSEFIPDTDYIGHFDLLYWTDLKEDLSACERLQRKPFYKIALLQGKATYHSHGEEIPIFGYSISLIYFGRLRKSMILVIPLKSMLFVDEFLILFITYRNQF